MAARWASQRAWKTCGDAIADGARNGGGCAIGEHRTAHICLANSSGNVVGALSILVEALRMQHRASGTA
ncbi:hypothetical protein TP47_15655 [Xanthomonas citri pv. aurantifolii]|uniref:Uncharacterized protein n=3 Tax=Xanthomonas citri TaxID=346 RepID=A0AB33CP06_XANCI|nr:MULTISPECIES: hypothetical protein [Xanthomonas]ASK92466.1 hypothetical protein XcvCFBP7111P_14065 [Xanthomonas citri pv. vignicola]MBZ3920578.1 hypothetical protein [Xanthomonas campestris pv. trichodesmae]MBZ3924075.1 hypothetical protein [Xanthomonas citri pv. sesbaniae]OQP80009.1 hypothetical protein IB69_021815 [Xanthomonas citri]AMU98696.1 hypothetical protein TP37_11840 [Xanthomonas citri pv. aurantifolii]